MTEVAFQSNWSSKRLKYLATYNDEVLAESTDEDKEIDYIEISGVSLSHGIEEIERMTFGQAPSRARRKVRGGDILISTVRTYLGAIAKVNEASPDLIASTGFCVVRPHDDVDSGFLGWAAKSEPFVSEVVARSVGVSYPAINASDLVTIDMPLPPVDKQRQIARFLDEKTARIDGLIEKKRALLDRLAEKRQTLITRAVTKGLNPDAPMKPSGIEWLGDIPAHWEVKRLGHVSQILLGLTYSPGALVDENNGIFVIRASNIQNGKLVRGDDVFVNMDVSERIINRLGDIVVCSRNGSRNLIGKNAIVTEEWVGCTFGAFMTTIRTELSAWVRWVLASTLFEFQSGRYMSTTINQLTTFTLKSFPIPIPPKPQADRIAQELHRLCLPLDTQYELVVQSVEKLAEYRAALITAAVTGQLMELR